MAAFETGQSPINYARRCEGEMTIQVSKLDDVLGPHLILQNGLSLIYLWPTDQELMNLRDFADDVLKQPT